MTVAGALWPGGEAGYHGSMRSMRPTIGLLLDYIEDGYQLGIVSGAREGTVEQDVNLMVLSNGVLEAHACATRCSTRSTPVWTR